LLDIPRYISFKKFGGNWGLLGSSDNPVELLGNSAIWDSIDNIWVDVNKRGEVVISKYNDDHFKMPNLNKLCVRRVYSQTWISYSSSLDQDELSISESYFKEVHKDMVRLAILLKKDVPAEVVSEYKTVLPSLNYPKDDFLQNEI